MGNKKKKKALNALALQNFNQMMSTGIDPTTGLPLFVGTPQSGTQGKQLSSNQNILANWLVQPVVDKAAKKAANQKPAPKPVTRPVPGPVMVNSPTNGNLTPKQKTPNTVINTKKVTMPTSQAQDVLAAEQVEGKELKRRRGIKGTVQNVGGAGGINPLASQLANRELFG